jgi:aspartate kinase
MSTVTPPPPSGEGRAALIQAPHATLRKNSSPGGWVVQKFGGTSIGKFAVNIAEDIVRSVLFNVS